MTEEFWTKCDVCDKPLGDLTVKYCPNCTRPYCEEHEGKHGTRYYREYGKTGE